MSPNRLLAFLVASIVAMATPTWAAPRNRSGLQEVGVKLGYGPSSRGSVGIVPIFFHGGWFLPDVIDLPLARHDLQLQWIIEPWIAGYHGQGGGVEFGVHPIAFKLAYDGGQTVVPWGQIGTGVMYTSLQGIEISGPFEFSSYASLGVDFFLNRELALSLSGRIRHISNAGIEEPNRGLNTYFGLLGLTWIPERE